MKNPAMKERIFRIGAAVLLLAAHAAGIAETPLKLGVYLTAGSVADFFEDDPDGLRAVAALRDLHVSKVYIEVYRSGLVVDKAQLERVRDHFLAHGFEAVGGIATTPGRNFGVHQEGPLGWFNWQNPKTQQDLDGVMRNVADVFDTFIVDDFLCTGDVSEESNAARGGRPWSEYRRDLLVDLSSRVFIEPARTVNPDITMIIKYPQWYDKFHEFGYDVARQPALFDGVWVGTETRGAFTQRYGFVQPYEGFVNYRWLAELAGEKIGGAWFDHGDCDGDDFVDQAYQTVLAGARDIVIFEYGSIQEGHPGHALLKLAWPRLTKLAAAIAEAPVWGVEGYKPPNSPAGPDLFLFDYIGMLGVPFVPRAEFPGAAKVVLLATQAASDPDVAAKRDAAVKRGARIVTTTGFEGAMREGAEAFLERWRAQGPVRARAVILNGQEWPLEGGISLGPKSEDSDTTALLTRRGNVYTLNISTFTQADYDAVDEVLLPPRPLGLLELPRPVVNKIRAVFNEPLGIELDAPARVTLQPFGDNNCFIHNYNRRPANIALRMPAWTGGDKPLRLVLAPRERIWLRRGADGAVERVE